MNQIRSGWRAFFVVVLYAAPVVAQAATIEYVKVAAMVGGAIGGGGNTLTYSSSNGLTSQGLVLPPSVLTQTNSGTTNLPNQTAAWVSDDAILVNGSQTYHSVGYASADLATGKIGVLGSSGLISGSGAPVNGLGVGSATIRDAITFFNANSAPTAIDVFFTLSGSQVTGPNGSVGESMRFCLGANCGLAGNSLISNALDYMFFQNSAVLPNGNYVTLPTTGWVSASFTPGNNPASEVFHGVYLVPVGASTVDLYANLKVDCRFDATCDYSGTGTLALNLASGVTFSSASGALLTAFPVQAVPEPGTWLLAATGALVVICGRRRIRR